MKKERFDISDDIPVIFFKRLSSFHKHASWQPILHRNGCKKQNRNRLNVFRSQNQRKNIVARKCDVLGNRLLGFQTCVNIVMTHSSSSLALEFFIIQIPAGLGAYEQ